MGLPADRRTAHGLVMPERLDWNDRVAVSQWLRALRTTIEDADGVMQDALRPLRKRELGPVLHRQLYRETAAQLRHLLAFAVPPESEPEPLKLVPAVN